MKKLFLMMLVVAGIVGGLVVLDRYEIHGLNQFRLVPRTESSSPADTHAAAAAPRRQTIRIATFDLGQFDENSLANARVRDTVAQVIGRFDLVALQGVHAPNHGLLVRLLEQVNAGQREYDFAAAHDPAVRSAESYNAFVFDRTTIEVDRTTVFEVEDPTGHLQRRPLAGSFRARAANPAEAFTFTLVNVYVDSESAPEDLDLLDSVYRAVRERRPNEDDVLLLGTLRADRPRMAWFEERFRLVPAVVNTPTTTRGTQLADNILLSRVATVEFTGRSGVVDLMSEFSLSMQEALEVSEHLPVWAEFSVYEGGQPGQLPAAR